MTRANSLNPIASIEYGENGLQFGQIYNKMENVWVNLDHLQKGEYIVNLVILQSSKFKWRCNFGIDSKVQGWSKYVNNVENERHSCGRR